MSDIAIARALHVLAVVHWIGGTFMVIAVILPAVARFADPARMARISKMLRRRHAAA